MLQASWHSLSQPLIDGTAHPMFLERRFALDPFGYPQNTELCADLGRRAPQLVPYLPRR